MPHNDHLSLLTPSVGHERKPAFTVTIMSTGTVSPSDLQKLAFETLSKHFQDHENDILEIEILPPALEPTDNILLKDGLNLGIPKKILVLAYLEARERFFQCISSNVNSTTAALQATKVILLFDPEHVTAANYRKRRLFRSGSENALQRESTYHKALRQELCFLNSILMSPLHRQSKSPTLWHHRLCILNPLLFIELADATEDQRLSFWRSELDSVCKSGEQHPKNYYAWQYARRFVARIESVETKTILAFQVKGWCCKHPSDISGWSFLLSLMTGLGSASQSRLLTEVLSYTVHLHAQQESLWVFIRTALAQAIVNIPDSHHEQPLEEYIQNLEDYKHDKAFSEKVSSTLRWIKSRAQSRIIARGSGSQSP